jgi:hypothetical protein
MPTLQMKRLPIELLFWVGALIALWALKPGENHYSLCVLDRLGFKHCPGCGIGRSIHSLMHGDLSGSWQWHIWGVPSFFIIILRIITLFKNYFSIKHNPYEPSK